MTPFLVRLIFSQHGLHSMKGDYYCESWIAMNGKGEVLTCFNL